MKNNTVYNGVNFYFNDRAKDKVVVFIHGNSLDATTFVKQFEGLSDLPLLAIDLPGHGLSNKAIDIENAYCMKGYINALRSILEHLELNEIILAGHSLGGHIAIEASNEINTTKGLMIFGTPPIGIPPQMDKMFAPNPAMGYLFSNEIQESDARLLANEFVHNNNALANKYTSSIMATDGNARTNLGASIAKGQFKNERQIIEESKIPVAIINGERDAFVNKEYIDSITTNNLWRKEKLWLKDTGHVVQEENAEKFNDIIREFHNYVFK